MTVILYPDHTLPVAAINIWYRVGSKDEPAHRSGFAHLFEHLMFMGTDRVPNGEFDRIMEAAGGSNNASTVADGTHYYSSGPASLLPTLLWLDADRLEDLPRAMDQKKVDLQRDVVLNELRQSYENQPYGRADLAIQQLLYPPSHPYHFPTIGTAEDLRAAVAADVKDFFATYYVPNNASLVVAGDFDPAVIKPLVERLFGTLPRGGEPPRKPVPSAALDGVKRGAMYDKVQLPLVSFAYHTPPGLTEGDANCDLLASVLADGKSSRLYKRLVIDDRLASSVSASNASQKLGSYLRIDVQARPDADLDRVEKAVDEEIARLLTGGIRPDELTQRKETTELSKLSTLQRLEARADLMNYYEDAWGEPNGFKRDLDRYRTATPASVLATAKQVLTPNARVVFRVLPEQPKRVPSARDTRPPDGPVSAFRPTPPERFRLANGIPVELWRTPDLPLTRVSAVFRPDGALDPSAAKAGLASFAANMLDEGAGTRDALAFGEAVASLGGSFSSGASRRSVQASLTILSRNVAEGVPLLADAVRRPRLAAPDFERVKRLTLDGIAQSADDAPAVADRVAARALFGGAHPYAWPEDGTADSVGALTLDDMKAELAAVVRPETATLVVASSLPPSDVRATLEKAFGDWKAASPAPKALPDPGRVRARRSGPARLPRGSAGRAADDRSFPRAVAAVRGRLPRSAAAPRDDPRRQLHEQAEPESPREARLHVRRGRPVLARAGPRDVLRRSRGHGEGHRRGAQGVPEGIRAPRNGRRDGRGGRKGARPREERRRRRVLGPLGHRRDRDGLRRARRPVRDARRGPFRDAVDDRRGRQRKGEDGGAARPLGPRPRGRQGDDPSAAQGGGAARAGRGRCVGGEEETLRKRRGRGRGR